ncbi:hypothetical protein [Alkalihalobacterium alkalinitrilicum]|uniref:hypothetical protein n=1 Tax=Alkalihalobacterium alkalinitrilicum TaxID=427920 RepID=UPI000995439A|nr:hypothetical protein [Alkalihalobacterium alkalinitrilicum]
MSDENQDYKVFLEEQLQCTKERVRILDEIDLKLHQMKKMAEYAVENTLTPGEVDGLNRQINDLKYEVDMLEKQLHTVDH